MKFGYDAETDTLRIVLSAAPIAESDEDKPGVILDYDKDGNVVRPAWMTVSHNGIVVQSYVPLTGPTAHKARPPYKAHADKLPISLQDHSHPVRFRNIWIREIAE